MIVRRVRGRGFGSFIINPFQTGSSGIFSTIAARQVAAPAPAPVRMTTLPVPAPEMQVPIMQPPRPAWQTMGSQPGGFVPPTYASLATPSAQKADCTRRGGTWLEGMKGEGMCIFPDVRMPTPNPILQASASPTPQAPPTIDAASSAVVEQAAGTSSPSTPAPARGGILGAVAAGAGGGLLLGGPIGALLGAGIGGFLASRKKA